MQKLINKYFKKLCSDNNLINDNDEVVIGKAKDIIQRLKEESEYVNNPENDVDEESIEFITQETKELIEDIESKYKNKNNIIGIRIHPMTDFYMLVPEKILYDELKQYYEEAIEDED